MAASHSKKTPAVTGAGVSMDHCAAAAHHGWHNTKSPVVHRPPNDDFSMTAASLVLNRSSTASAAARAPVSSSAAASASASALAATPRSRLSGQAQASPDQPRSDTLTTQLSPATLDKDTWSMAAARGALEQSFIKPKADKQQEQQKNTQMMTQALPLRLKQPLQQKRFSAQPAARTPSEQALSAATVAHAPFSGSALRRASAPAQYSIRPRSMYSASALVNGNSNVGASGHDKDHQEELHATALAMAQQMFAQQQTGGTKGSEKAEMSAAGFAQDPLHEKAWKLAQARLAQMDDGSMAVRDSQSYYIAKDRTASRKFSRLGQRNSRHEDDGSLANAEESNAEDSDAEGGDDGQPRSIFAKRMSDTQVRKRQNERDALLAAARRNVENKLAEIDEETMATTGRLHPRHVTAWEAQAQKAASRRHAEQVRAEEDDPGALGIRGPTSSGKYNVGRGVMVEKAEVEALANQNLEPLFTDIKESAATERERKERERIEEETKKQEETAEKARKGKLSEIGSIFNGQKKREEKERKRKSKQAEKEAKQAEKEAQLAEKKKEKEEEKEKEEKEKDKEKGSQRHSVLKDSISAPVAITGLGIPAMATHAQEPTPDATEPASTFTRVESSTVAAVSPTELVSSTSPTERAAPVTTSPEPAPVYPTEPVAATVPVVPNKSADRNLPVSSEVPVMSATVSPEELHDFPASPTNGLSPINESSTPSPDTTAIAAAPFTDGSLDGSTHATTIENNVATPGAAQAQPEPKSEPEKATGGYSYEHAVPAAALAAATGAGVGAAATGTGLESPRQSAVDSIGSPLHPLQSNPPMVGSEKRISDNVDVDSAYDPTYDQKRVSSVYDQVPQQQQQREEKQQYGHVSPGDYEEPQKQPQQPQQQHVATAPIAAVGSVGGGLANSALVRDATATNSNHHDVKGVPSSELSRDERREASLERARQTQLNAAVQQKRATTATTRADEGYEIPVESETSPADRVRSWFRTHVRSRKDISDVGGLDNSDMLVIGTDPVPHAHAQTGLASTGSSGYGQPHLLTNGIDAGAGSGLEGADDAERSSKQKKRSSFLSKLTSSSGAKGAKGGEKREFVHEPSQARGKDHEAGGLDVPPVPKHLKQDGAGPGVTDERASRFKEVMQ